MANPNPPKKFRKGDPRTIAAAKLGGAALREAQARRRAPGNGVPYAGTVLDLMDAAGLDGPSWFAWRVFLKVIFALEMDEADLALYRRHTGREHAPSAPFREVWLLVGRRGGKSRIAAVLALFLAIRFDSSRLAPGELAVVPILAADRKQARVVMGYLRGLLDLPTFEPYQKQRLKETIKLHNRVTIEVHTASFRTIRGYSVAGVVLDEIAFWSVDGANPDEEIVAALRPAMATMPDALLLGLSSPYAARGELFRAAERYFGREDAPVLVWNADSKSMNAAIPAEIIERAFEEDPVSAASEYGQDGQVVFRRDVEAFLDPEAVRAVMVPGQRELPPLEGTKYVAFTDPSGGSQDSWTLAIAHAEGDLAVVDVVREVRPPFSPDDVVKGFADLLKSYRVSRVGGDRYGGEFPRALFRNHGITYEPSELTKSDLYRELLPVVNSGRAALLDLPVLRAQLVGLERRVARSGKDSIDHGPLGRDDVANAVAGAISLVVRKKHIGSRQTHPSHW